MVAFVSKGPANTLSRCGSRPAELKRLSRFEASDDRPIAARASAEDAVRSSQLSTQAAE